MRIDLEGCFDCYSILIANALFHTVVAVAAAVNEAYLSELSLPSRVLLSLSDEDTN